MGIYIVLSFIMIDRKEISSYLTIIGGLFLILFILSFFVLLYHLPTLYWTLIDYKYMYAQRCYALTEENKWIAFRNSIPIVLGRNISSQNTALSLIEYMLLRKNIKESNEEFKQKVEMKNIPEHIENCIEFTYIDSIIENKDKLKIKCNYIDLKKNRI